MKIGGIDPSSNHYALVLGDTQNENLQWFVGWNGSEKTLAKWQKQIPQITFFHIHKREKNEPLDLHNLKSQWEISKQFLNIFKWNPCKILGMEGYAYRGSYIIQLAELMGQLKGNLVMSELAIRIHDPLSIKMWAGSGNYGKLEMIEATRKYENINIPEILCEGKNSPASDMADAYFLLDMIRTEIDVRKYPLHLNRLSEKKKQVFNRVTKAYPENLLVRPFLALRQPSLKD